MYIDSKEFIYICFRYITRSDEEKAEYSVLPSEVVNDPVHDVICGMETDSILHDIFGHCIVAHWEPCFNGVRK